MEIYQQVDQDIFFKVKEDNILYKENYTLKDFFNIPDRLAAMDSTDHYLLPFKGIGRGTRFLGDFLHLCNIKGYNDEDDRRVDFMALNMAGPAKVWFEALPANQKDTWPHLQAAFTRDYMGPLDPATTVMQNDMFSKMKLGHKQKLEEYQSDILVCGIDLEKDDAEMAARFVNGLPEKLAFFVRARAPGTLAAALSAAKIGETHGYREHPETEMPSQQHQGCKQSCASIQQGNGSDMPGSSDIKALINGIQTLTQVLTGPQVNQLHAAAPATVHPLQSQAPPSAPSTYAPTRMYHQERPYNDMSSNQGRNYDRERPYAQERFSTTCDRCQARGHKTNFCNMREGTELKPWFSCGNCGQKGHGIKACKAWPGN